jgi:hypothetical protein
MIPGGYLVVVPNETNVNSQLDLEALFNAMITSKDRMIAIFNQLNSLKNANV